MSRFQSPCRVNGIDCEFRHAHCDVDCEKWKKYLEIRNKNYEERKKAIMYNDMTPGKYRRIKRSWKDKKK